MPFRTPYFIHIRSDISAISIPYTTGPRRPMAATDYSSFRTAAVARRGSRVGLNRGDPPFASAAGIVLDKVATGLRFPAVADIVRRRLP